MGSVIALCGEEMADIAAPEEFPAEGIFLFVVLVGIVILFVFSRRMKKIRELHKEILQKQQQTTLLNAMSENIHNTTKGAIGNPNSAIEESGEQPLENVLPGVAHAKNRLLDMTNNLIGFLKLKSGNVEITSAKFNLNNVLNEVAGSIGSNFQKSNVELIFDINKSIPRFLIGDSLHLGQVLVTLLENSMMMTSDGEVILEISKFSTFGERLELKFRIMDTGTGIAPEELKSLFEPHYDDATGEYRGLKLFVAKELIGLMGGELTVQSVIGKGSTFAVVLPWGSVDSYDRRKDYLQNSSGYYDRRKYYLQNRIYTDNRRKYRLPEEILMAKKVVIVDSNYNSALAIKKMFAYFRHDVKIISRDEFVCNIPDFNGYDIVVLDEKLLDTHVVAYLKKIKADNMDLKVVGLSSLLYLSENRLADMVVDRRLQKPLNQERIFDLIVDLYRSSVMKNIPEEIEVGQNREKGKTQKIQVYKADIAETKDVTRESFADFRGASILVVDDNMINQKVLTNILDKSGIEITLASNGEVAVHHVLSGRKQFDLVLMDINMPLMDGYTATEKIRDTGRFEQLPIVAFTAYVLDSEVKKAFASGMNACLEKPLNLGKLYSVFRMFIGSEATDERKHISSVAQKKIDGLDIREGIRLVGGSEALYIEILKEFLEAYGESGELLEKLMEEKRFEQIKMLTLDMKGLTGTIGAKDMYREVDEIYKLFIYNNQSKLPLHVDIYTKELSRLKQAISQYLEEESAVLESTY
jgi:CheY-like chemotaxis protein/nitrogen-specific signal transduction histidine kinase